MALPIGGNGPVPFQAPQIAQPAASGTATANAPSGIGGASVFADKLREFVSDSNAMQSKAQESADAYARGNNHDLHGTMIDMAQADVSVRLLANVRNRVIDAYREVMRMGA